MKKLFFVGVLTLTTLISCQNDSITEEQTASKQLTSSQISKERQVLIYKSSEEVYYKDERLVEDRSENAMLVQESIKNQSSEEYARRKAFQQCMFTLPGGGGTVHLTQVYGNGQASTYWITFIDESGVHTYENPGLTCSDVYTNLH
ncbi:hypothetical protein [Chryseobacterium viscerum]|uniref:Lipoprotein n=1 Tax=Chryseobacterium viscerum TaxID=1037377 RepID=A0A5N4BJ55_9FLAO|nr:hypothetical protein [Chryseobacterium viscerum]KAB1228469.1 hypothetical protein F8D52_22610 [Chryseobacterium viscerum]